MQKCGGGPLKEKDWVEEKNAWGDMFRNDIIVIVETSSVEIIRWVAGVNPSRNSGRKGYGNPSMYTLYGQPGSGKI